MSRTLQAQVLIGGAGPVGLTPAIDLAGRGIVDREPALFAHAEATPPA